jgi:DNA modification methylase
MIVHCPHDALVNVKELKPNPLNRNSHPKDQIERLAKILEFQGWRYPIKVSKRSGFITSGHGRLEAAKLLKWKEVPVSFQDYDSEEQEYADTISDNSIASWSELDLSGVNADLTDLGPDFDIDLLGIKDFVLEPIEKLEPQCDEDEVPDALPEPKVVKGEVYILGNHRLMCGDSTAITDVERLMDGKKADMVFTDPPYGVDYEGINNDSRDGLSDLLSAVFDHYLLSIKNGAPIYCFHSDRCADLFHQEFRKRFHFSSMVIWVKPQLVLSQTDYQSRHEPCIYGWKEGAAHAWHSDRKQTSVWEFGRESVSGHTTPKPVDMVAHAIGNSSKIKGLVLDLFGGSGSTLIACEKTDRHCFMMELDPHYCGVILDRWQKFTGKKAHREDGVAWDDIKAGVDNGAA